MCVTIHYELSETGRKAALVAGQKAQARQENEVPRDHPRYAEAIGLAEVDTAGRATIRCSPVFDHLPTIDELLDGVVTARQQLEQSEKQHHDTVVGDLLAQGAEAFILCGRLNEHGMRDEPRCQPLIELAKRLIAEGRADDEAQAAVRKIAWEEAEAKRGELRAKLRAEREAWIAQYGSEHLPKRGELRAKLRAEREAWIAQYGSEHLRRLVTEGIECDTLYRQERLMHDYPGWRYRSEVPGDYDDAENPPPEAIALLDDARRACPNAKLVVWESDDEECYAAMAPYLDAEIVFGGPEESN